MRKACRTMQLMFVVMQTLHQWVIVLELEKKKKVQSLGKLNLEMEQKKICLNYYKTLGKFIPKSQKVINPIKEK